MPPAEVLRCDRCLHDKKKCELQDGTNQCERCIKHKCPCENRVWRVPKRRSNADNDASNQDSRKPPLDGNAANSQYSQALQLLGGSSNSDHLRHGLPAGIRISSYQSSGYGQSHDSDRMIFETSFVDSPQSQTPTSFMQDTEQIWPGLGFGDNDSADTGFGLCMPHAYDQAPSTYSQQDVPIRRRRRQNSKLYR